MSTNELIVKIANKTAGFTILDNGIFKNPELSARAIGIYCFIMHLPTTWEIHKSELYKHFAEGRAALDPAFAELENAGYIKKELVRDEGGKFSTTRYQVFEVPPVDGFIDDIPNDENLHYTECRLSAFGKPTSIKYGKEANTNSTYSTVLSSEITNIVETAYNASAVSIYTEEECNRVLQEINRALHLSINMKGFWPRYTILVGKNTLLGNPEYFRSVHREMVNEGKPNTAGMFMACIMDEPRQKRYVQTVIDTDAREIQKKERERLRDTYQPAADREPVLDWDENIKLAEAEGFTGKPEILQMLTTLHNSTASVA